MIKFLQFNAKRSTGSHDLAEMAVQDNNIGILLISEPNVKTITGISPGWFIDNKCDAAIKITDNKLHAEAVGRGDGFVWIIVQEYIIFSCYISPNVPISVFRKFLDNLKVDIRKSTCTKILVGGDLNSKSQEWGSSVEDSRGTILSEWISELGFMIINSGNKPTFVNRETTSIIDITLASIPLCRKIKNWIVSDEENLSDHNNIYFEISENVQMQLEYAKDEFKWRFDERKKSIFQDVLKRKLSPNRAVPEHCTDAVCTESL